jgi:hypothetical protein
MSHIDNKIETLAANYAKAVAALRVRHEEERDLSTKYSLARQALSEARSAVAVAAEALYKATLEIDDGTRDQILSSIKRI